MTMKKYFQLVTNGATADLDIYGDIAARWWDDSATDARKLSKMLEGMDGVQIINVHINSYGGEVAEGLAIYNALRRHKAKVRTTCDGFACSIASVIFMAGDERVMSGASLLMVHNAWTSALQANASDLRKLAEDMDAITQASKNAYMSRVSIDEARLSELMDAETWILPAEALEMGFATEVEDFAGGVPLQGARSSLVSIVERAGKPLAKAGGDPGDDQDDGPDDDGADAQDDQDEADGGDPGDDQGDAGDDGDPDNDDGPDDGAKQSCGLRAFLAAVTR